MRFFQSKCLLRNSLWFFCLESFLFLHPIFRNELWAQQEVASRKDEIGASLDVFAPVPGTIWDKTLTANLGLGAYYRSIGSSFLLPEVGIFWSYLPSSSSQRMVIIPVYFDLGFKVPVESRLEVLPKIGLGAARIQVQPANITGWAPFLTTGLELSILAARWFRIGVRTDYLYILDSALSAPKSTQAPVPEYVDDRLREKYSFKKVDGHFLRFGIVFGFLF